MVSGAKACPRVFDLDLYQAALLRLGQIGPAFHTGVVDFTQPAPRSVGMVLVPRFHLWYIDRGVKGALTSVVCVATRSPSLFRMDLMRPTTYFRWSLRGSLGSCIPALMARRIRFALIPRITVLLFRKLGWGLSSGPASPDRRRICWPKANCTTQEEGPRSSSRIFLDNSSLSQVPSTSDKLRNALIAWAVAG